MESNTKLLLEEFTRMVREDIRGCFSEHNSSFKQFTAFIPDATATTSLIDDCRLYTDMVDHNDTACLPVELLQSSSIGTIIEDSVVASGHVAASFSALDIEHSGTILDTPANCSMKCPNRFLATMVATEASDSAQETVIVPTYAGVPPTTAIPPSCDTSTTNDSTPFNCLMKCLGGDAKIQVYIPMSTSALVKCVDRRSWPPPLQLEILHDYCLIRPCRGRPSS